MIDLFALWTHLASGYTSDKDLIVRLWKEIEDHYSQPRRHYHNTSHLQYMITWAENCRHRITDWDVLLFAVFYHDIIHKPGQNHNEEKSADLAQKRLQQLQLTENRIERCRKHILATRKHETQNDADSNYLLDLDLAVLGEDPDRYMEYVRNVHREYAFYPDYLYKKKRREILLHYLAMDRIYKTEEFYKNREIAARRNLMEEVTSLTM